jgi:hypothetical protein
MPMAVANHPSPPFKPQQQSFGRPGQPAELDSAYVLLAADTSSYTSGTLLTIAGGAVTL